jgi:hypothetical protein
VRSHDHRACWMQSPLDFVVVEPHMVKRNPAMRRSRKPARLVLMLVLAIGLGAPLIAWALVEASSDSRVDR